MDMKLKIMFEEMVYKISIITNGDPDVLLNYVEEAYYTIISYCNIQEGSTISNPLKIAIKKLALLNYRNKGKENISQESQGSRSRTYKQVGTYVSELPSEIEVLCKPYRRILAR